MNRIPLFIFMFLISSVFVIATNGDEFALGDIVDTISGFNIAEAYLRAPLVIDGILYFIIFIGLGMVTLSKRFEGRGGKALIVGVGLALAISMTVWTSKTGFRLMNLGPFAGLMFALLLGFWIFKFITGDEKAGPTFWFAIMVIYIMMYMFFPELMAVLSANKWGRFLLAVLSILFVIAIPLFLTGMFRGEPTEAKDWRGMLGGRAPTAAERRRAEREEKEEEKEEDVEKLEEKDAEKLAVAEIREINAVYERIEAQMKKLERVRNVGSAGGTIDWATLMTEHNRFVEGIKDELTKLIYLDEKIKNYTKRFYGRVLKPLKRLAKRATSRRYRVNKKFVKDMYYQYRRTNVIEVLTDRIKKIIEDTKDLPIPPTASGTAAPAASRLNPVITTLGIALTQIKTVYNNLAKLLKADRKVIAEIP